MYEIFSLILFYCFPAFAANAQSKKEVDPKFTFQIEQPIAWVYTFLFF